MRSSGEFQLSVLRRQQAASFIGEVEHKCFGVQPCADGQERKGQGVPRPTRFGRCAARLAGFPHPSHGGSELTLLVEESPREVELDCDVPSPPFILRSAPMPVPGRSVLAV